MYAAPNERRLEVEPLRAILHQSLPGAYRVTAVPNPSPLPLVYLIEERPNPSTDYFVLPALLGDGYRVVRHGFHQLPEPDDLDGAVVLFVRYVPAAWVRLVESARTRLADLVFFMDDDLFDAGATHGLPWRYRLKLARLARWRQGWLRDSDARLWVSTPFLQRKYANWRPRLLHPSVAALSETGDEIRVFYHGSASHAAEIRWLYPVMEAVVNADPRILFEIVGGRDVYRAYRRLPRTRVVHPMSWPAYQSFVAMPGRHIGLAPLLDHPFNRARSCTKFFDITRAGAVGVYAAGAVCAETLEHEVDAWLVPMRREDWIQGVLTLAEDAALRQRLLAGALRKLSEPGALDRGHVAQ